MYEMMCAFVRVCDKPHLERIARGSVLQATHESRGSIGEDVRSMNATTIDKSSLQQQVFIVVSRRLRTSGIVLK